MHSPPPREARALFYMAIRCIVVACVAGSKVLTTCIDNRLRVWDSIWNCNEPPSRAIVHSQDFNRCSPFDCPPFFAIESFFVVETHAFPFKLYLFILRVFVFHSACFRVSPAAAALCQHRLNCEPRFVCQSQTSLLPENTWPLPIRSNHLQAYNLSSCCEI